jgi:hypothetical protein
MKPLFTPLLIIGAAALGLTAGLILQKQTESTAAQGSTRAESSFKPQMSESRLPAASHPRPVDDSPLATQLAIDLSMSEGVTRWLYWFEALEKAVPADFPRLASLAKEHPAATRLLAARWIELDPRHLFHTISAAMPDGRDSLAPELPRLLFEEWTTRDPQAVIAALSDPEQKHMRMQWGPFVADRIMRTEVELGLRLLSEWNIASFLPRMDGVARWAAADPAHAARFAFENQVGYASQSIMETIGKEWARTDPVRVLEFSSSKAGGFGSVLGAAAVREWAGRDIAAAADWLARSDARTRNRLSASLVEIWATQDPAGALAWCNDNLTGSALGTAVGGAIKGIAAKDVAGAARLVAGMPPSAARVEAALAVSRTWLPDFVSGRKVDPETINWLAGLDSDSIRRVLSETHWNWATSDPASMAEFVASMPEAQVFEGIYAALSQELARKDPAHAIEWANRLPPDKGLAAGGVAFAEWRRAQPQEAANWMDGLSSADPRRNAFFEAVVRSIANGPQAVEQLAAMDSADRARARSVLRAMSIPEDRRSVLLDALESR